MTEKRTTFLGLPFDRSKKLADIVALIGQKENCHLVTFITPDSWALAARDPKYLENLRQMDLVLSGNDLITLAIKMLYKQHIPPVRLDPGDSTPFFEAMVAQKSKLAIIGGDEGTDESLEERLTDAFPLLPVKVRINKNGEWETKINAILDESVDVVLVDLDIGMQEDFLQALKRSNFKGLAIACNGLFDAWTQPAALPGWAERWYVRPIYQFSKNPVQSKQRYFKDYPDFAKRVYKAWMKKPDKAAPPPKTAKPAATKPAPQAPAEAPVETPPEKPAEE